MKDKLFTADVVDRLADVYFTKRKKGNAYFFKSTLREL